MAVDKHPTSNLRPGPPADPARGRARLAGLLLFLAVLGLFLPAVKNGFVNFDDQDYVTENARVQQGLTWENVSWAFASTEAANWHPLTWLSHMADCQIYGLAPWGHHLTSVLLHALNTLLVFLVWRKMTGAAGRSLFGAALFGLHPLHVESVAWVAERKDLLSTLFFLLALWTYTDWAGRSRAPEARAGIAYGLTLLLFALGLMCKPMLVTLPFVLLLLDYWPLDRFRSSAQSAVRTALRLGFEKLPFFGLALASSIVTAVVQKHGEAFHSMARLPFLDRLTNALVSYVRCLGDIFYPVKLAVFYQHPGTWPAATAVTAGVILLGITLVAVGFSRTHAVERRAASETWRHRTVVRAGPCRAEPEPLAKAGVRAMAHSKSGPPASGDPTVTTSSRLSWRYPYLLVGWLWFAGTLVPVIGLVQIGMQAMADRYTYIPSLGVFVLLAWGAHDLTSRWRHQTVVLRAAAAVSLIACAALTHRQIGYWADSEALFRHATEVTDNCWVMHNDLGQVLLDLPGRSAEAIGQFEAALQLKPDYAEAHNNLGNALAAMAGRSAEAIAHYEAALQIEPNFAEAHNNLGNVLAKINGRSGEAIGEYEAALRIKPGYAEAHDNLGNVLAKIPDRVPEAITHFETALRIKPDNAAAHFDLGNMLAGLPGRLPEAIAEYQAALRIKPGYAEAHFNLANVLVRLPGRQSAAIAEYESTLRLRSDYAEAHNNLGAALVKLPGRLPDAVAHFEAAVRLRPDLVNARFNLGAALMLIPEQRSQAILQFEEALRLKPDFEPARQMLDRLRAAR